MEPHQENHFPGGTFDEYTIYLYTKNKHIQAKKIKKKNQKIKKYYLFKMPAK